MYTADSIKVADSLIFKTEGGRTVFGGGGIVPDYFVPLDTTGNSTLLTRIFNTSSIHEFTFEYATENRTELEQMGMDDFIKSYTVSDGTLQELLSKAESNGVKMNQKEFEESKLLLETYVKAFIARNIWDNKGFYPVINAQDNIIRKALKLIPEAKSL